MSRWLIFYHLKHVLFLHFSTSQTDSRVPSTWQYLFRKKNTAIKTFHYISKSIALCSLSAEIQYKHISDNTKWKMVSYFGYRVRLRSFRWRRANFENETPDRLLQTIACLHNTYKHEMYKFSFWMKEIQYPFIACFS